jgi:TolB protein
MSYSFDLPTTRRNASPFASLVTQLALIAPLALAACADHTPAEPALNGIIPLAAKGGSGGGGGTPSGPTGRLYFTSDLQQLGNYDIYAVNPDGTGLVRLTTAASSDQYPRAALLTGRIAFLSDRMGTRGIYTMNADGSSQQAVYTPNNGTLGEIALSADGARIAFTATVAGQTDIWAIGADGSGLVRLTNDAIEEHAPAWSPRGREIAYSAQVNGATDIFELTVNGGRTRKLTGGLGGSFGPAYSPDGRTIAFSSTRDGNYELYTMRSDGSQQTRILATPGWGEHFPSYSPDGRFVAYLSQLNGGGLAGMRWALVGNSNQTGPVSSPTDIYAVSWGL